MGTIARIYLMAVRHDLKLLVAGYVAVLGAGITAFLIPRVLGSGIDRALDPANSERGMGALVTLAIILALLGLSRGLFSAGQMFIGESVAQRLAYRLRNSYYDKLQR